MPGVDVDREFAQVSQVTRSGNLGDQAREDYRVLTGAERTEFVRSQQDLTLPPARHLAIFTRRAVLNVEEHFRGSPENPSYP